VAAAADSSAGRAACPWACNYADPAEVACATPSRRCRVMRLEGRCPWIPADHVTRRGGRPWLGGRANAGVL